MYKTQGKFFTGEWSGWGRQGLRAWESKGSLVTSLRGGRLQTSKVNYTDILIALPGDVSVDGTV